MHGLTLLLTSPQGTLHGETSFDSDDDASLPAIFSWFPHASCDARRDSACAEARGVPAPRKRVAPYHAHRFGADSQVVVLDSGHWLEPARQTAWLRRQLLNCSGSGGVTDFTCEPARRMSFAIYHVPLYPGARRYWGGEKAQVSLTCCCCCCR